MKKVFLSVLFLGLGFSYINAQDVEDSDDVSLSIISTKDSGLKIVEDFKETESEHFLDPKTPHYLLYDKKRNVAFGVGGSFKMRTSYTFDGTPTGSSGFIPYNIPVPSDPETKNKLGMDVSKSTLFFKLLGNNSKLGRYQVYISGEFNGNNNAFVLNDAYMSMLGFTVGRTWSTFNDLAAVPPTVDPQGPNGAAEMRTPQIRYTYSLDNGLSFALAAELSQSTSTFVKAQTAESTQRLPDIPAYVQYNWGNNKSSHVRLAGVLKNVNYRNLVDNKTETLSGFGVQMSSKLGVTPFLTLYAQATYGKGIEQYINDLAGNGLTLQENPNRPGKMELQEALGWYGQAQFNLTKSVFATAGYSQAKLFPKSDLDTPDSQYRYGQYLIGNVFYNLNSNFQLGAEYVWGNRVNMNGDKASANCVQAIVQFNF